MRPLVFWPVLYVIIVVVCALVGFFTFGLGNALFIAGALVILFSVGFVGAGGETRHKLVRNMVGIPITIEKVDPADRKRQISTGMKVFLLGLALWVPLLYLAFR